MRLFKVLVTSTIKRYKLYDAPYLMSIIFSAALLSPLQVLADKQVQDPRPMLVMGYIEFAPYYYTDTQGQPQGHLIELALTIADKAGYQLKFRRYPTRRAGQMLIAGKIDIWFGLPSIIENSAYVLTSQTVIDSIQLMAYRLKPLPDIETQHDLKNKKIVILRGYKYGGWIDYIKNPSNNIQYLTANSREQAVHILAGRNADYLLDYKLTLPLILAENHLPNLDFNELFSIDVHMLASKKLANSRSIMHQFEKAFMQLGTTNPVLTKKQFTFAHNVHNGNKCKPMINSTRTTASHTPNF